MEKERILLILEFLQRNTSATQGVSVQNIRDHLSHNTLLRDVSPMTIRRDIDRLIFAGYDIQIRNGAHNTAFYSLVNRTFSFNEIRFFVDSICINRFISNAQKKKLIQKFEAYCSDSELRQLSSRIILNDRTAPNLDLLKNLDVVHSLISEHRHINFDYGKYDIEKNVRYYSKQRELLPCKVVYWNERFYLRCMDETNRKPRTYRIDRMRNIRSGEVSQTKMSLPKPEATVVDIFEPDYFDTVTFRIKEVLLDDMLEIFGNTISARIDTEHKGWFLITVRVGISKGFFRWFLRYGNDLVVISPPDIRKKYLSMIDSIQAEYNE